MQLHPFPLAKEEHQRRHPGFLPASPHLWHDVWCQHDDQWHALEENCMYGCAQICPHCQSVKIDNPYINLKIKAQTIKPNINVILPCTCSDRSFDRLIWILDLSLSYSFAHRTLSALALFWRKTTERIKENMRDEIMWQKRRRRSRSRPRRNRT